MATVMSPPLTMSSSGSWLYEPDRTWFCTRPLRLFFEVPDRAKRYWVEARTRQWADGSGQPCTVQIAGCNPYRGGWSVDSCGGGLTRFAADALVKMGIGDSPTTIYICLWYED